MKKPQVTNTSRCTPTLEMANNQIVGLLYYVQLFQFLTQALATRPGTLLIQQFLLFPSILSDFYPYFDLPPPQTHRYQSSSTPLNHLFRRSSTFLLPPSLLTLIFFAALPFSIRSTWFQPPGLHFFDYFHQLRLPYKFSNSVFVFIRQTPVSKVGPNIFIEVFPQPFVLGPLFYVFLVLVFIKNPC